jgi:wyosine [tRNA(Phe)-imidazoG37] synthetase (radical SAM superfamily)
MTSCSRHVYGPVPSRRLGASLGVDVVPMKACTYDCIYCQLGPTRTLTTEREHFFTVEEILDDVGRRLDLWPPPEVITVAGCGEPTLYAELCELLARIKRLTQTPVALLTNGSLFYRSDVRRDAARADIVLPSLDAGDEATFQAVNRPAPSLTLKQVVEGLAAFRREYTGEIWLEVMVLAGINDTLPRIGGIAHLARAIAPDRIQLNTPVRPTFDERAAPVSAARLHELRQAFSPEAEVIAERKERATSASPPRDDETAEILDLLQRRPCTAADVAEGLDLAHNAVLKTLTTLEHRGEVHRVLRRGRVFWHAIVEGTLEGTGDADRGEIVDGEEGGPG